MRGTILQIRSTTLQILKVEERHPLNGVRSARARLKRVCAMKTRTIVRHQVAELKARIIRQQESVAELARSGNTAKAREARQVLYQLLNQLDLLESQRNAA